MYIGKKHARYQYYLWLIHKLISGPVLNLIRLISRLNMIERNMVLIISHLNPIYIIVCCTESLYYIMDYVIGILDASREYCLYIVYIYILCYRMCGQEEFEQAIAERRERYRS